MFFGRKFMLLSSLKRHQREQHFDVKFNVDFYEGLDPPKNFVCEQCDQKFKRMLTLADISKAHTVETSSNALNVTKSLEGRML